MTVAAGSEVAIAAHRVTPPKEKWRQPAKNTYRCKVYILPEVEGGFSVVAADLPGVASQGDTERDALDNIAEAFQGVIAAYHEGDGAIPWSPVSSEPEPGAIARWVFVHV